jgi:hypothetical protein
MLPSYRAEHAINLECSSIWMKIQNAEQSKLNRTDRDGSGAISLIKDMYQIG